MYRVIREDVADQERGDLREAAFIGWQFLRTQPTAKGKKHPTLKKYLTDLGLSLDPKGGTKVSKEEAIAEADRVEARVREAFKRKKGGDG